MTEAEKKTRPRKSAAEAESANAEVPVVQKAETEMEIETVQTPIEAAEQKIETAKTPPETAEAPAEAAETPKAPRKFKKEQLIYAKQFKREERYFLEAILKDTQEYTIEEAKKLLEEALAKGVK